MRLLTVRHATTYRYARPVTFGPHRLMLRPRDSHDLRLVSAELTLSPPGNMRWMHDVFGNSVALVEFTAPAPMLSIASTLKIERYGIEGPEFPIAPGCSNSIIPIWTACWRVGRIASSRRGRCARSICLPR